jgi:AcrR family transcriptional regulator
MRVRTEDRRQAIMQAAMSVFREVGYERARMSEISARVGGSKATLYGYFKSKEELFAAAMLEAVEEQGEQLLNRLDPSSDDIAAVLEDFGGAYLTFLLSPQVLAVTRTAVAEGASSKLGPLLYERGPQRAWRAVAAYLTHQMAAGALPKGDAEVAAAHLKGLLEAGIMEPALYGAEPYMAQDKAVKLAVRAFLLAHGPNQRRAPPRPTP